MTGASSVLSLTKARGHKGFGSVILGQDKGDRQGIC